MSEVPADADALLVSFRGSPIAARMLVVEANPVMGVVTDRLHALPARRQAAEQRPGKVRQLFGVAVAAAQQIDQNLIRQLGELPLPRVWRDLIGLATDGNPKVIPDF